MDPQTLLLLVTLIGDILTTISLLYIMQTSYRNASCITRSLFATIVVAFLSATYIHLTEKDDCSNIPEMLVTIGSSVWFGWRAISEYLTGQTNDTVFRI